MILGHSQSLLKLLVLDASHIKYRMPPWIFFAPEVLENG